MVKNSDLAHELMKFLPEPLAISVKIKNSKNFVIKALFLGSLKKQKKK
jgi:hypothetical protein